MNKTVLWATVLAVILCLGIFLGWLIPDSVAKSPLSSTTEQVRVNLPQYKFINPPLFSESAKSNDPDFKALAASMGVYVASAQKDGSAESVSVYFRDLNAGNWTGVNEDALYTPSSMLKVVAMMAALKLAESNPTILSERLKYHKSLPGSADYFYTNDSVASGSYSLEDLIGYMIKFSDNDAFDAIVADPKINAEFVQIYSLFRLPTTALIGSTTDFMSPRSFSSIFRTLYNSSFFEWNLSEQVLDLLSQTTFTSGIAAGVPAGTPVAHKFGENTDELHDCGIVYYPDHPYLLCVMTRGNNAVKLESVIQGISGAAWSFMGKQYPAVR